MVKSLPFSFNSYPIYHIGVEVKSVRPDDKGDSHDKGRGAIEDAATQICRGLNGMVESWVQKLGAIRNEMKTAFLPVIFTTAHLWVSDVDLSASELETGKINFTNTTFVKKPWIIYQYHMTPNLKHLYPGSQQKYDSIGEFMESEYIRSIAIVNPAGIREFLTESSLWAGYPL